MHLSMRDLELGLPKAFMKNLTPIERYIIFSAQSQKHPLYKFLQWKEQASQAYANYCIMQIARKELSFSEGNMEALALAAAYGHSRNALALTITEQRHRNVTIDFFRPKTDFYPEIGLKLETSTARALSELRPHLSHYAKKYHPNPYPQGLLALDEFNRSCGARVLDIWLSLFQHPLYGLSGWLSSQEALLKDIQASITSYKREFGKRTMPIEEIDRSLKEQYKRLEDTRIQIALSRHFVARFIYFNRKKWLGKDPCLVSSHISSIVPSEPVLYKMCTLPTINVVRFALAQMGERIFPLNSK